MNALDRKSFGAAVIVFCISMLACFAIYQSYLQNAVADSKATFNQEARLRALAIEAEINRSFLQVEAIGNLFSSSDNVSLSEFRRFVKRIFAPFPEGRRLSFVAVVKEAELGNYQKLMQKNTDVEYQDFTVFDFIKGVKYETPTLTEGHAIVLQYTYPDAYGMNFIGRNIAQHSPIASRIFPVLNTLKPYVSSISEPIPQVITEPFFLYVFPVIKNRELLGVVSSNQKVSDIFETTIVGASLDLFNYDVIDNAGTHFSYPQGTGSVNARHDEEVYYEHELKLKNNTWKLRVYPHERLINQGTKSLHWIWVTGSIISFLLALLVAQVLRQQGILTAQVASKTKKLSRAVDKANRASQVKSEFLANMSHEIRTPLNGIVGFTQLLKTSELNNEQSEFVDKIDFSINHLMMVINDILDFSKIESGGLQLEEVPFSVFSIIDYLHITFDEVAENKGIKFKTQLGPHIHPDLKGDSVRINQILLNLCSNAIKFTSKGEIIVNVDMQETQLSDGSQGYELCFRVSDTGIGIDKQATRSLFSAFTQADTSTTRRFGGTGLGLAISQKLCQLMSGEISVESEKAKGSTFTATMKARANDMVLVETESNQYFDKSFEVLVVDDNPISVEILQTFLQRVNVTPTTTTDPKNALAILKQDPDRFKIVICDWIMPELNGDELIKQINQLKSAVPIKVIVISAYEVGFIKQRSQGLSIFQVIKKPCTASALFNILNHAIKNEHATPEVAAANLISLKGLKVLIAEDNEINQVVMAKVLELEHAIIDVVENGQECLDALEKSSDYDLVLMDINMPEMDGMEATRRIRRHHNKKIATIPIIALTANVIREDIDKYLELGMTAHVPKPFNLEILKQSIQGSLR